MPWTDDARAEVTEKILELWPTFTDSQLEATINHLDGRFPPGKVVEAARTLFARQERPRRPSTRELEDEIRGVNSPGGLTPRLAAYREMERLEKDLHHQPTIELRGKTWEVLSTGVSRETPEGRVSIPAGDLTDSEVHECLLAVRTADGARRLKNEP